MVSYGQGRRGEYPKRSTKENYSNTYSSCSRLSGSGEVARISATCEDGPSREVARNPVTCEDGLISEGFDESSS